MESFLVYLFNFYYAISELEQNKQNNTIIFFFTIYFFNKKEDLSSLRGGGGGRAHPSHPPPPPYGPVCHSLLLTEFMTSLSAESIFQKRRKSPYERMGRTLQTSEAESCSKRDNERQSRCSSTSCVREGKTWNMEQAFFQR